MPHIFDIAIVGLGPAGATLARLLPATMSVCAIDKKSTEPHGFQKPCGGLLSPDAQKALARFNLTLPVETLVDPQIFTVRTIDLASGLIRHYQRFYLNLDREKFDRWMISLVPPQVKIYANSAVTAVGCRGVFEISLSGEDKPIYARKIVGADGAASVVRKNLFPQAKTRKYLAIQQWFTEQHSNPFYSCIFDPETSDCCSWSISKDRMFIFGGAFPIDHARQRFEQQKEKLETAYGFKFGEPLKTEACLVFRPRSMREFCLGADRAFLVGEAAGFISPSSLEGISFAINSACSLAESLAAKKPEKAYARKTLKLRLKILLKVAKSPFMYNPLLRKLIMKSGLQTIDVI